MLNIQEIPNVRIAAMPAETYAVGYRTGWYMRRKGEPYTACQTEGERDGWVASNDSHAGLVKVEVRQ